MQSIINPQQQKQVRPLKQRRRRKRKNKAGNFSIIASGGPTRTPFPKEIQTVFRYVATINLTGSGDEAYVFRLNSLYDFDYTSTGKQPFQYDQMTAVYQRYRVYNTKVELTIMNYSTSAQVAAAFYADNINASQSSVVLAQQMQFSTFAFATAQPSSKSQTKLIKKYNIANCLGYQNNIDEDLSAATNTNPVQVLFGHLLVGNLNGGVKNVYVNIYVELYALMYDMATLGDSLKKLQSAVEDSDASEEMVLVKKSKLKG